jgi:Putative beta-barrel porin-2, OmpL-like. bbp2
MGVRRVLAVNLVCALALAGVARAQTVQERLDTLEKKVEDQSKGLASALGIDIHTLVAVDYLYSFNKPDSNTVQYRVFDPDHNNINLNQFNLMFSRQREDEPLGFVANLDFGRTAEVVGSVTCWNHSCSSAENDNSFELREAYLTYKLPWDDIVLKAGKFVTLLGYEVIKSYNAFNPNISNSIMFGYAIPFTHTGLLAHVPMGNYVAADVGVINGWDDVADNNDSKSFLGGIGITPSDAWTMYFAATYGAEQPDNGHSKRAVVTANSTVKVTDQLSLAVDMTYGNESDLLPHRSNSSGLRGADWYGIAGYSMYQITDDLSFNFRAEVFDDPDGVRSGFTAPGFAPGVTVWELTPTISYQVTKGLLARAEYRHDEADKPFFDKGGRKQNGSDTVAAELIYAF